MSAEAFPDNAAAPLARRLHCLAVSAGACADLSQLAFHILNRTIELCPYDRAVLWTGLAEGKPRLLGISGEAKAQEGAPLVEDWLCLISALAAPAQARRLHCADFASATAAAAWERLAAASENGDVCWIPIAVGERLLGGLWLERWQGQSWSPAEVEALAALGQLYALSWLRFADGLPRPTAWRRYALLAAAIAVMCLPVPLRVTAPCEVIARDPAVVTAPIDGVIAQLRAQSGEEVAKDEVVAVYDQTVLAEESRLAALQVEMLRAEVERGRASALADPARRAEIAVLEARLAQAEIRKRLAEERLARAAVKAPQAGVAMVEDAASWRGRPVRIGERLLTIVDTKRTRLRLWVACEDDIALATPEIRVALYAEPSRRLSAKIAYASRLCRLSPDGIPAFAVDAEWLDTAGFQPQVGNRGFAHLYGQKTPLIHWLLRRPWLRLRLWLGI
ncbi:MAG: efflux RND transporter periplasmic adaptor subunit [Planctomycetota bacterium]|nr:efflux RND transporter periplasmic adaptor subunit [Planctomycetota bacterium]